MSRKIGYALLALLLVSGLSATAMAAGAAGTITQVDTVYISVDQATDSTTTAITGPTIVFGSDELSEGNTIRFEVSPDTVNFLASDSVRVTSLHGTRLVDNTDTTRVNYAFPDTSTGVIEFKVDSVGTLPDTLTFSGFKLFPVLTSASYDSTTVAFLWAKHQGNLIGDGVGARIVLLPGEPKSLVFIKPTSSDTKDAGAILATATVEVRDQFGNRTAASPPSVTVTAYLKGSTVKGNGTLRGTTTKTATDGRVEFSDLSYTKAEDIQLWATASGLETGKFPSDVWYEVNAATPKHVTFSVDPDTFSVLDSTKITVTLTDEFYNPVDDNEQVTLSEVTVVGGQFRQETLTTNKANGTASTYYIPSHYYTGKVTLKAAYSDDVSKTLDVYIIPGPVGNVALAPAEKSMVVGTTTTFTAELVDAFGNHVDASSVGDVTFWASAGTVGSKSLTDDKKIAVEYTARTQAGNTDTLWVQTSSALGGYTDYSVITTKSGPPATMKFYADTKDTVLAQDTTETAQYVTLVDSLWDQYGNKVTNTDYYVHFQVIQGSGRLSADSVCTSTGKIEVTYYSGRTAGTDIVKAWYGSVEATVSITVLTDTLNIAQVDLQPDTVYTQAGQEVELWASLYDRFGNHWALADTAADTTKVNFDTSSANGYLVYPRYLKDGNVVIKYKAYDQAADTALVIATYGTTTTRDTSVVINSAPGVLDHFHITIDDSVVATTDFISVTLEARDANDIRIWTYKGNVLLNLNGSTATGDQVSWWAEAGYDTVVDQGVNAFIPDSSWVQGQVKFWLANHKAEGPLTFTAADTALGVSTDSPEFTFVPGVVYSFGITAPDTVTAGVPFAFTVTPYDVYGNVNTADTSAIEITANYPDEVDLWPASRYISGATVYRAVANVVRDDLKLIVLWSSEKYYYSDPIAVIEAPVPAAMVIDSLVVPDTVTVGEAFEVQVFLSDSTYSGKVYLSANKPQVSIPRYVLAEAGVG